MPNWCEFTLKAVAREEKDLQEFKAVFQETSRRYSLYRLLGVYKDCEIVKEDAYYTLYLEGACAWSIRSSLLDTSVPGFVYSKTGVECLPLDSLCEKLSVGTEVWSRERRERLQEHYLIRPDGCVWSMTCRDWTPPCIDESVADTDKQNHGTGGFQDWGRFATNENIYNKD